NWVPVAVRLAARRMACEPSAILRLLAGLALLVMVAGISAGVMRDIALRAGPSSTYYRVSVDGSPNQDPDLLRRVFELDAPIKWSVQHSIMTRSTLPTPQPPATGNDGDGTATASEPVPSSDLWVQLISI